MKILLLALIFSVSAHAFDPTVTLEYEVKDSVKRTNILFVIDNSGSMSYHQEQLANMSNSFLKEMGDVYYKITAVSTDTLETVENLVIYKKMADPLNSFKELINSFGTNGSAEEKILDRVIQFTDSSYGKRFLKGEAPLEVIALSDEIEQSEISNGDFLKRLNHKRFTFNGIVSKSNCPSGQVEDVKLKELSLKTGGMLIDICQGISQMSVDYEVLAKNIVKRANPISRKVPVRIIVIKENIDIDSIKVFYGSQKLQRGLVDTGWVFNTTKNTIIIGKKVRLDINQPAATKFTVQYNIL